MELELVRVQAELSPVEVATSLGGTALKAWFNDDFWTLVTIGGAILVVFVVFPAVYQSWLQF